MPFLAEASDASPQMALGLPGAYLTGLVCSTAASSVLVRRFGSRSVLMFAIAIMAAANIAAVGMSGNFNLLAALIFVQGLASGPIPPLMQKLVADSFPAERKGTGMAIWQGSLTIGAMLGGLIGGFIISNLGPAWIFILMPVFAVPAMIIVMYRATSVKNEALKVDLTGLFFLVGTVLCLTLFLNLGSHLGWFHSPLVTAFAIGAVVFGLMLSWTLNRDLDHAIDLRVLQNRDLAIGIVMVMVFFGITSGHIQNQMLVAVFDFGPDQIAQRVGWGGPVRLAGVILCGFLAAYFSIKRLAFIAITLVLLGKFGYVLWQPGLTTSDAVLPFLIESLGAGMFMVCLAALAYQTLGPQQTAAAASIYVLSQRLGSNIGLAVLDAAESMQQSSLAAAGLTLDEARGAAFLGISWIELIVCLNLVLGIYLFQRIRPKHAKPIKRKEKLRDQA
jgi:DHA2 family multidrug resistance protein